MNQMANLLRERISHGLKRRSITSCWRWAEMYRVMKPPFPGPWTGDHHPWLKEPHDPGCRRSVFKKAAQVGLTETFLNRTFYNVDVRNHDTLYVLPSSIPDASDFSASRFDAALALSPHLRSLFGDTKNVGLKRAGATNVYIRGSRSRSQLKSVPVGSIIFDEVDEMPQANIALALERTSGQLEPEEWFASTPSIPNYGIDRLYNEGTSEQFFIVCPCCSRRITLTFPECLEITAADFRDPKIKESFLKCPKCKGKMPHETKTEWTGTGIWVAAYPNRDVRSFGINQLYSHTVAPHEIATLYLKARSNPEDEQELYNSKFGLAHIVAGARLTDEHIENCQTEFQNGKHVPMGGSLLTLGADVGHPWIHYVVNNWKFDKRARSSDPHVRAKSQQVMFGKVQSFDELDAVMMAWRPQYAVVDSQPERKLAEQFARRFDGHVSLCTYDDNLAGRGLAEREDEWQVRANRTSWMDMTFSRFKGKTIYLPCDLDLEYKDHLKANVRVYERDKNGNPTGRYVNGNNPDHYAHACVYAEIALSLAAKVGQMEDLHDVY